MSADYNGPRDSHGIKCGIIKFMKTQVGPASKVLTSTQAAEAFLATKEVGVVYFGGASKLKDAFFKVADKLRESIRFTHSFTDTVNKHYGKNDVIVLYRPKHLGNKFEPDSVTFEGAADKGEIETFIKYIFHGLEGHRTQDTAQDFKPTLMVGYFSVDYIKTIKGTNYWRNRILKVAQNYANDFTIAIASKDDFQQELNVTKCLKTYRM